MRDCTGYMRIMAMLLAFAQVPATRPASAAVPAEIRFNRDVRPIMSGTCFKCHGPGTQKAGLRLDLRERALAATESGVTPIVPGKPEESEIVRRVFATDESEIMPPPAAHKTLTHEQKEIIRLWVAQGAAYEKHWSFVPPVKAEPPVVAAGTTLRTPIDAFIAARLAREQLTMSAEASRETLIRRVAIALTGLPPTLAEVDAYLADSEVDAYERMVDRYLASPRYGEEMARHWLDVARYADTHGLHLDNERQMWAYRDWVIRAFNANQPFDQFTIDQLAGDLLPNATIEQLVATGYIRSNVTTGEGGSINEEWVFRNALDRTATMAETWMGLTAGCAVCHDHKFDPLSAKEFYSLFAFFHSAADPPLDGNALLTQPTVKMTTPELNQRLADLDAQIAAAKKKVAEQPAENKDEAPAKELAALEQQRKDLDAGIPSSFIYRDLPTPRETFVMLRGQYNKPGEAVAANVPAVLPALNVLAPSAPANRLDLARWLVAPEHPLTARVTVNRLWQQIFGVGLVKTSEDFGSQGETPSHPELLDWLAVSFRDSGWNVKQLVRLMVTSAAFRQTSHAVPELWQRDRDNRLYARGPRFRLDAEQVRDNALLVGGLLNDAMGGRGVNPYQPPNIWEPVGFTGSNTANYKQDHGPALYRRSIYVFFKRTAPPPFMVNFDAPTREAFCARRERSNTPLQALHLMNDVQHYEAARGLAERMITAGGATPAERIAYAYRVVLARRPAAEELSVVMQLLDKQLVKYAQHPDAANAAIRNGESPPKDGLPPAELAAYTLVANLILNLDETLNRN